MPLCPRSAAQALACECWRPPHTARELSRVAWASAVHRDGKGGDATMTFAWQTKSFQNIRLRRGSLKRSVKREAWNYLENMFINSIVLSNWKLPPSCISQMPQLHILPHGTGLYNQVYMRHVPHRRTHRHIHKQAYTHTHTHTHMAAADGGAKSALQDVGGGHQGLGLAGQGSGKAGKRLWDEGPDGGDLAGRGRKPVALESRAASIWPDSRFGTDMPENAAGRVNWEEENSLEQCGPTQLRAEKRRLKRWTRHHSNSA
ncbi:hypothetical protein HJG60_011885 [Phyllostomus discolor]|uniref:Uncharacterized protein n=1 Tax=Phyllostomus discolor TaxID=89673 RepID=A0A833ZNX3_9CHIR|nr:hypothetical protein HJG60_011885 [Phyllostomus discolor]